MKLDECIGLYHGTLSTELEIARDGAIAILCPCCQGSGEHDSLPGNNPDNNAYPCVTCAGRGDINREFQERKQPKAPDGTPAKSPAKSPAP